MDAGKLSYDIDREMSPEERGTETNSFNTVFAARFAARLFSQAFTSKRRLAGRSMAETHCLALEGSPLDRPRA